MKLLNFLLLTAIYLSKTQNPAKRHLESPEVQCVLTMQVYPFQYIDISRTMSLRLRFESNCQPYHQPLYLELPWSRDYELTQKAHPKEVTIYLFDKLIDLKFSKPKKKVIEGKRFLNYLNVKVKPSSFGSKAIYTPTTNFFLIKDKDNNFFMSKHELDRLWSIDHPYMCSIQENKQYFVCDIRNID